MDKHFPKNDPRTFNEYVNTTTSRLWINLKDCQPNSGNAFRIVAQTIRDSVPKGTQSRALADWGKRDLHRAEERTGWKEGRNVFTKENEL